MPRLHVSALWKRVAQGHLDPCYFFVGEETYLIETYTATLLAQALEAASRAFNCDVFSSADTDTLAEAMSVARTLPMLASYRAVVLHGVHTLRKSDWPVLERYLAQPEPSTVFICSSSVNDAKKSPAALWQQAVLVECPRLEGARLSEWATQALAQQGYRIAPAALQALLQTQAPDLHALHHELVKLCTYVGENAEIRLEDVQAVTQASRQHSIFALADAVSARQVGPALRLIERLLHQGEPPLVILSLMTRQIRLLWSTKQLLQQRCDLPTMAKSLGVPQGVCRQLATQSQQFALAHLRTIYAAALEADLTFKSTSKPPQAILEALILQVCLQQTTLATQ